MNSKHFWALLCNTIFKNFRFDLIVLFYFIFGVFFFYNLSNFFAVTRFLVTPLLVTRYCVTLFSNTRLPWSFKRKYVVCSYFADIFCYSCFDAYYNFMQTTCWHVPKDKFILQKKLLKMNGTSQKVT